MMMFLSVSALSVLLACYMFYYMVTGFRSEESERRRLEQVELRLTHILRLLEAPDVRLLMQTAETRQALLLEFSQSLRKDVLELLRAREGGLASVGIARGYGQTVPEAALQKSLFVILWSIVSILFCLDPGRLVGCRSTGQDETEREETTTGHWCYAVA